MLSEEIYMKFRFALLLATGGLLASACLSAQAADSEEEQLQAMEATAERIKQGARDFEEKLKRIREERKHAQEERERLQETQAAERRMEAERAREQAKKDAEALAATKAKERQALQTAQEKARREAAALTEKAERERQAALAEKLEREEKLARAKAALEKMNADRYLSWDAEQPLPQAEREARASLQQMKAQTGPKGRE